MTLRAGVLRTAISRVGSVRLVGRGIDHQDVDPTDLILDLGHDSFDIGLFDH